MEQGTTVLLGLPGVAVERVEVQLDGTRLVHVVTADPDAAACPSCRVVSTSGKQHVMTRPKDLPYGATPLRAVCHKRRWRCRQTDCATETFTEAIPQVPSRIRTMGRLRALVAHAVADNRSVAEVATSHDLSWPMVQRAVDAHVEVVVGEPEPTPILGVDETRRGKPRWCRDPLGRWHRVDRWDTGPRYPWASRHGPSSPGRRWMTALVQRRARASRTIGELHSRLRRRPDGS